MPTYPAYVPRAIAQAREDGQWHAHQADAAALCFDVLADFPECHEASEAILEIFCDEWTIYQNRRALARTADEWDDRPQSQRRRLASAAGFMSRWDGKYEKYENTSGENFDLPADLLDVAELLDDGKMQLIEAYCLGDEECTNYAWPRFLQAVQQARDPNAALMWIGNQYYDLGFFSDAAEVLAELCYKDKTNASARRLLAEVRWWRDFGARVPWLPPPGDGSRYRRIMPFLHPDAPTDEETIAYSRARLKEVGNAPTWQPNLGNAQLSAWLALSLPDASGESDEPPAPISNLVDWSYLDTLPLEKWEGHIPLDKMPAHLHDMIKELSALSEERDARDDSDDDVKDASGVPYFVREMQARHYLLSLIPKPTTPKRYHPKDLADGAEMDDDADDES